MRLILFLLLLPWSMTSFAQIRLNDSIMLSGFGTVSAATSDSNVPVYTYRSIDDHLCLDCDTTLGIQLDWLISNQFRASFQAVKRPQDTFSDPELEWAYLAYNNENSTFKLGRQRLPLFIMSQYYYVSAAYSSIRPPEDVYSTIMGITHYDGISYEWSSVTADESQLRVSPFVALPQTSDYEGYGMDFTLKNKATFGVIADYIYQDSTFHFGYIHSDTERNNDIGLPKTHYSLDMIAAGVNIVDGNFTYTAEGLLEQSIFATWYAGIAYQYNKVQPYLQYGQRRRMFENNSVTGGMKVSITPSFFVNLEWSYITSPKTYQTGHFDAVQFKDIETEVNVYTLSASFLF